MLWGNSKYREQIASHLAKPPSPTEIDHPPRRAITDDIICRVLASLVRLNHEPRRRFGVEIDNQLSRYLGPLSPRIDVYRLVYPNVWDLQVSPPKKRIRRRTAGKQLQGAKRRESGPLQTLFLYVLHPVCFVGVLRLALIRIKFRPAYEQDTSAPLEVFV